VINNCNIEDNVEEESIKMVITWVFQLAAFCDEFKKKHKLEAVLNSIAALGILSTGLENLVASNSAEQSDNQCGFKMCESILYKVLISIEKCLPKYSLKYYAQLYIDRPGIFHLYFIDQVLAKCDPFEVLNFMVELVERWIGVEMRDLNMLEYVCKFTMHFLDGVQSGSEKK
jgi:hypothetical protein